MRPSAAARVARALLPVLALLLAAPAGAHAAIVSGTAKNITIPAPMPAFPTKATPYPSDITFSGQPGRIVGVTVELQNMSHSFPVDLDILLEGPNGKAVVLMSDVCGVTPGFAGRFFRFETGATTTMPVKGPCPSDTYAPSGSIDGTDSWPEFSGATSFSLSDFLRESPNGTWRLRVTDDANDDGGEILQWALTLTTAAATFPPSSISGDASPYPVTFTPTIPGPGVVKDVNVTLPGLVHFGPDTVDAMVQAPTGQAVLLMSGACGDPGNPFNPRTLTFDDEAAGTSTLSCPSDTSFRPGTGPLVASPGFSFGSPTFTTSLSAFDLLDPRGTWKLFLADRSGSASTTVTEQLTDPPQLTFTMQATPLSLGGATASATEGGSVALDITRTDPGPYAAGTVRLKTADGTATAGADYTAIDQTVTFGPGETTKRVTVPVIADGDGGESAETFTATVSSPTGDASVGTTATTTVTINADPAPTSSGSGAGAGGAGSGGASGGTPIVNLAPIVIARLPSAKRCVRAGARLTITPTPPRGVSIVSARVRVDGRTVATRSGSSAVQPIRIRPKARKARFRVVVTFTATDGRTFTAVQTYTRCRPKTKKR